MSEKVNELRKEIKYLESDKAYNITLIGCLMSEANLIDTQIEALTRAGLILNEKIRDLKAELRDTE